ncbi:hypothetical protein NSA19_01710 [Actinomyces bowdenii]|uniref:hypothetical protein n=1 Tax=Actinomyces bowdenii TaxID=131109 RepID=UPI00214AD7C0|nr:hypothetical protein [Actinomyces bowdenii]MCR2051589.1 hypothetical protein [Actinomyces bowdenii]
MSDSINTHIPGSAASVNTAGDWLDKLKTGFDDARLCFLKASYVSDSPDFSGELAAAASAFCLDISNASADAYDRAKTAVDNIYSFADQLTWRQEDMEEHRQTATEGGLTVTGYLIMAPTAVAKPDDLPKGATKEQKDQWYKEDEAYDDYLDKKELFESLKVSVKDTHKKLEDWIALNLVVAEADVLNSLLIPGVKELIKNAISESPGMASNVYAGKVADYQSRLMEVAAAKAASRSANPAVRNGKTPPSQQAVDRNYGRSPKAGLASKLSTAGEYGKAVAKKAGVLITLTFAGAEIASGGSPSKAILTTVGGLAAGSVAATAVAGVVILGSTVAAPIVASIVVSAVVVAGVGYAYENWVSKQTREKIDESIRDFGNGVKDAATGAWNGASEGLEDAADWVEDRWKLAFG